jgi:bromodomain adjacent to zinc finger domain protein 1A
VLRISKKASRLRGRKSGKTRKDPRPKSRGRRLLWRSEVNVTCLQKASANHVEIVAAASVAAEKREAEAQAKAEKQKAKEEAERIANEKKKKKPIRYPTEDLDVRLSDKEKKAGMRVQRPVPHRDALPFNDDRGTFEAFLMTWNFLIVYGWV